ncbi:MAG: SMP-30/gluconolactonase/LRE family protein [Candidatus Solibacter usitatus]|nr:SMP-30/gluconolactonase/LRE family protein [Candidatus Solibacter usitatus]
MRTWLLLSLCACTSLAQDFSDIHIEKIAAGNRFTEGPVWSREGFLLFSDVPNNRVIKWVPGVGLQSFRDNSNGVNGNTMDAQGRLYSCESRTRRVVRLNKEGNYDVLADKYDGKRLNAPNDIVVRRDGHLWFTDPAFGEQEEHREMDYFGIYHITPKGELNLIAKPKGRPNGVALSPNGRILYVANSDDRTLVAYDVDGAGRTSNERVFIKDIDGPPDGIRVDEKGNVYVTCNQLAIYTPQGKLLKVIEFPETPRNCAFGDADFQTLYVTALTSVYRVRLKMKGSVQY